MGGTESLSTTLPEQEGPNLTRLEPAKDCKLLSTQESGSVPQVEDTQPTSEEIEGKVETEETASDEGKNKAKETSGVNGKKGTEGTVKVEGKKQAANVEGKKQAANVEGKKQAANVEGKKQPANVEGKKQPANVEGKKEPANVEGKKEPVNVEGKKEPAHVESKKEPPNVKGKNKNSETSASIEDKSKTEESVSVEDKNEESAKKESEVASEFKPVSIHRKTINENYRKLGERLSNSLKSAREVLIDAILFRRWLKQEGRLLTYIEEEKPPSCKRSLPDDIGD